MSLAWRVGGVGEELALQREEGGLRREEGREAGVGGGGDLKIGHH
jgi:hypothetical protein